MLLNICLQMPRPCLPVVGGVADAAGEEDEFIGISRREHSILGVASDHPESVDELPDKEIGLAQILPVLPRHDLALDKPSQCLHRAGRA